MKIIRISLYIGLFFILLFVFTQLVWGILLTLPPDPNCGEFDCLDRGFLIVIGTLLVNAIISLAMTFYLYWRFEIRRNKPRANFHEIAK